MEENRNLEQKIIDAARHQFIERGFERTSMSDIAAAAGINRTTLHYYFRTKEKMFQAVFGSIMQSFLPRIQVIFDQDKPLIDKFSEVVDEYFRIFAENPSLPRFIMGEINRDVEHLLDTGRTMNLDVYLSSIEQVIRGEMARGTVRTLPTPTILLTFMSQITFPFMARNLLMALFYQDNAQYDKFLVEWKENIMRQMRCLLTC